MIRKSGRAFCVKLASFSLIQIAIVARVRALRRVVIARVRVRVIGAKKTRALPSKGEIFVMMDEKNVFPSINNRDGRCFQENEEAILYNLFEQERERETPFQTHNCFRDVLERRLYKFKTWCDS